MTEIKISLTVDLLADAAYVKLSNEPIVRTARVNAQVLVDLDATDMVVGIDSPS